MRRKPAMRTNKPRNLLSIATVSVIVVMLVVVLHVGSQRLLEKKEAYDKREAYLLEEIAKEEVYSDYELMNQKCTEIDDLKQKIDADLELLIELEE